MTPELSRQIGAIVGNRAVSPDDRETIQSAAQLVETYGELPQVVRDLLTRLADQPTYMDVLAASTDKTPGKAAKRSEDTDLDDEATELWRAGDENGFKKYWLTGKGLKKWALSARPWTALFKHLVKHMPPEKARQVASRWFIEHFHYASGSDRNRVEHGHPPRGNKVGPG